MKLNPALEIRVETPIVADATDLILKQTILGKIVTVMG